MNARRKISLAVGCIAATFPLLLGIGIAAPPTEPAPTLDQLLTQAMDNNPGIIAAKAKVVMAEADLKNARFEVARQLVACWNEVEQQKAAGDLAKTEFQLAQSRLQEGQGNPQQVLATRKALIDAEAKLARARSELEFLAGKAPPAVAATVAPKSAPGVAIAPIQIPRGPMVEKLRQQLAVGTEMGFAKAPLGDVVAYLKDKHGIEIQLDVQALDKAGIGTDMPIFMSLKNLSLGAVLQAWDDMLGNLKLVVRDYGILVTTPERAREAGYMPLVDFARLGPTAGPPVVEYAPAPEASKKSSPTEAKPPTKTPKGEDAKKTGADPFSS